MWEHFCGFFSSNTFTHIPRENLAGLIWNCVAAKISQRPNHLAIETARAPHKKTWPKSRYHYTTQYGHVHVRIIEIYVVCLRYWWYRFSGHVCCEIGMKSPARLGSRNMRVIFYCKCGSIHMHSCLWWKASHANMPSLAFDMTELDGYYPLFDARRPLWIVFCLHFIRICVTCLFIFRHPQMM